MASVTQFIKTIKQPKGGYLPIKAFTVTEFDDNQTLHDKESVAAVLIGTLIDSFSRFLLGDTVEKAFHISLLGAKLAKQENKAKELLGNITGLNDLSIYSACQLVGFDTAYRGGISYFKGVDHISADDDTIANIKIMLERCNLFFKEYGPVIESGITFKGGYTDKINSGDADFLTSDTLWDMKVLSKNPTTLNTIQLLIYYCLMRYADYPNIENIRYLGMFNPRKNLIYRYSLDNLSPDILSEIQSLIGSPL